MSADHPQPADHRERRRAGPRSLFLPLCVSLGLLLAAAAVAAPPLATDAREAALLDSSLQRSAAIAERQVQPLARRLAQGLPGSAEELRALREPAATTQEQVKVALDELRQMSIAASLDPHYLPALLAAGRAFLAASGQDPLTRTTVNPDYLGLERELAASQARLAGSARVGEKLAARVRQLTRQLAGARRRADRLALQLRRGAPAGRRR